jgi:hypothetical protein
MRNAPVSSSWRLALGKENAMKAKDDANQQHKSEPQSPRRISLPGFVADKDVGFGDMMKGTFSYFGIRPCDGCDRRAEVLNRWLTFTRAK